MVEVVSGREVWVHLTSANAEVVAGPAVGTDPASTAAAASRPETDPSFLFAKWQDSVMAVWSPTSRASGFVVDERGLIATSRRAIGDAGAVQVQLPDGVKVAGRVVFADPLSEAAMIWIDPGSISGRTALPLQCPPARTPSLAEGEEISTIVAPLGRPTDTTWGEVTGFSPRAIETDLRLSFGAAGGPTFNASGAVVGLTSPRGDAGGGRQREALVVRAGVLCEARSAAQARMEGATPPPAAHLPVEPAQPFPAEALARIAKDGGPPAWLTASSSDFDVVFLSPLTVYRAQQRGDRTGGASPRGPEVEARIGTVTEFGDWSEYFANVPPVLAVRVTPRMVEGFWKRLGREAARTQGAVLPAFKDFKTNFVRLRASCAGRDVAPIHPFVLEHRLADTAVIREGLYVFGPDAFGPQCGTVTLSLYSERAPQTADTITIDATLIERLWQELAPYRAASGMPPR
jgi:hypothetical protein